MMRANPSAWFGKSPIENRDLDLLNAYPVSFVDYEQGSYLRKVVGRSKLGAHAHL